MLSFRDLLFGGVLGYLVGSVPSAYLVAKKKAGLDLRNEGSRNIGARNAFEVTGDKSIGFIVLIADLLKGLIPVLLFEQVGFTSALVVLVPSLVLGHCYPVWLRFHGGRGLATAAGALLLICPIVLPFWLAVYFLSNSITKQVHFSAVMACGVALIAVMVLPPTLLERTTLSISGLAAFGAEFQLSLGVVVLIILSRHVEPLWSLLKGQG